MVSPLVAWAMVVIVFATTGILWLASAPAISAIYVAMGNQIPEEGLNASLTLRLEFIAIPIVIDVLFVIWAFLVTTRRQAVTTSRGAWG